MALGQLDFHYFLSRNCLTITFLALGTLSSPPQTFGFGLLFGYLLEKV